MKLPVSLWLSFALCMTLFTSGQNQARADLTNPAIGIVLGDPTGIRAKTSLSDLTEVQGTLAYSFGGFFLVAGDWVQKFERVLTGEARNQIHFFAGVGGMLLFNNRGNSPSNRRYYETNDSVGLGIRVPLGAEWRIPNSPVALFAEITPGLGLLPSTYAFLQGGVGAVYYLP